MPREYLSTRLLKQRDEWIREPDVAIREWRYGRKNVSGVRSNKLEDARRLHHIATFSAFVTSGSGAHAHLALASLTECSCVPC